MAGLDEVKTLWEVRANNETTTVGKIQECANARPIAFDIAHY